MINLETLLYSNYVRYDRLKEIVRLAYSNNNSNYLNIYIDLYSILKPIYSNIISDLGLNQCDIVSSIINMIAHYRHFFREYYGVETTFILVYSNNCPYENSLYYKGYNEKHKIAVINNINITNLIQTNMKVLEELCVYLPSIYFIKSERESSVVMNYIIKRLSVGTTPNMVITKDQYAYQLVANDNTIILRPKKSNNMDLSYHIDKNNLYSIYQLENDNKVCTVGDLSPELLSTIMALSSVKERNIKKFLNRPNAFKVVIDAIRNYSINNGYLGSNHYNLLNIKTTIQGMNSDIFDLRFKCIDIRRQTIDLENSPESKQIVFKDLSNPDMIKEINNRYFINNPLDLNKL